MPPAANRSRKRQRPQLATEPHSEATALATTSPNLPTNTDASDEVISESPQYTNMQSHTNDQNNERNFIFQKKKKKKKRKKNPKRQQIQQKRDSTFPFFFFFKDGS